MAHLTAVFRLQAFDELHLLKRGGKTIYAGPTGTESHELISYFEAIPGVPHIQPGMNPATWMLGKSPRSIVQHGPWCRKCKADDIACLGSVYALISITSPAGHCSTLFS